jgi:hypothetical protein
MQRAITLNRGIKMKKQLVVVSLMAAIASPIAANAFGLSNLTDAVTGKKADAATPSTAQGVDPSVAQDQLVQAYVAADKNVLQSQVQMASALGLKDESAKAQAAADALSSGATKGGLEDTQTTQSDVAKAITAKFQDKDAPALSDEAKKQFISGMAYLAKGAIGYGLLKDNVSTFKNSMSAMSPVALGMASTKLGAGLYVAKTVPTNAKNVYDALNGAVSFAKERGIPVPSDVASATSAI